MKWLVSVLLILSLVLGVFAVAASADNKPVGYDPDAPSNSDDMVPSAPSVVEPEGSPEPSSPEVEEGSDEAPSSSDGVDDSASSSDIEILPPDEEAPDGDGGRSSSGSGVGDDVLWVDRIIAENIVLSVDDRTYPSSAPLKGGYFIQADTSQLGTVLIYVPKEYQSGSFAFNRSDNVVSLSNNTINGVLYRGSTAYSVRWSYFGTPQYRLSSSSYTWEDLTIDSVLSANVQIVDDSADLPLRPDDNSLQLIQTFLLGGILLCLFMKRL